MDYFYKYKKYKNKYLQLKNYYAGKYTIKDTYNTSYDVPLNRNKKYGIVMFCILKYHYVLGACIASYLHKQ